jgi:hypothetical protein
MAATAAPPPPTLVKARAGAKRRATATHRARPAARTRAARAPARRAAPRRASHPITPLTPLVAVGRTAVAVTTLPDSGLVVRMTRGRLWIGVLGALLAGIVALNVVNLSLSSSSGRASQRATALERSNSALRAQIAEQLSNERVQLAAQRLGLIVPEPGDIAYLTAGGRDAANAAKRLQTGTLTAAVTPVLAAAPVEPAAAPAEPEAAAPTTTTTTAPTAQPTAPSPPPAQSSAPAQPTPSGNGGGGGVTPQ